jgi:DNA helicase-2/ATP-dependent DNA helicase PcrA
MVGFGVNEISDFIDLHSLAWQVPQHPVLIFGFHIHSAKGQEWESVFLLNTVDGCLPSDLATGSTPEIKEERRLLYVAMTRAKDQLHLMVPQRFFTHGQRSTGDRHVYAQRTRPSPMLEHFDSRSWPPPKSDGGMGDRRTRDSVDVRAKMRRMWG